jgi:UTP--glucose-1-phosphate uridylyltransferase
LGPLVVSLDSRCYKLIDDLEARFPHGPPSLVGCARLRVQGDVRFGRGVVCRGAVEIANGAAEQARIAAGATIEGKLSF